jgi:hypothetical protein
VKKRTPNARDNIDGWIATNSDALGLIVTRNETAWSVIAKDLPTWMPVRANGVTVIRDHSPPGWSAVATFRRRNNWRAEHYRSPVRTGNSKSA